MAQRSNEGAADSFDPLRVDDVTLPLMMALERLSPLERAAFLLHDVFGVGFDEVAETIGRDPASCRQLASRARTHVRAERPRLPVSKERGLEITQAFVAASRGGDMTTLRSLLAADGYRLPTVFFRCARSVKYLMPESDVRNS
jgi:RNA polymerase sigma-70 factor, ECF subfamily